MRVLSVTRWHHFSYFVISTALLGYGISGTLLSFTGLRLTSNYKTSIVLLCLAMSASIAILFPLAESLPLDIQYLLYSPKQLAIFALYNLLILIPFLFGATAIGLALMRHRTEAPLIYGFSMLGTAIGGAAAVGLMFVLPEGRLILAAAVLGWIAAAVWADIQIFSLGCRRHYSGHTRRSLSHQPATANRPVQNPLYAQPMGASGRRRAPAHTA